MGFLISSMEDLFRAASDAHGGCLPNAGVFPGPWFRGEPKDYGQGRVTPKIYRPSRLSPLVRPRRSGFEAMLFSWFRAQAPSRYANCPAHNDIAGWLTVMQHYGMMTRLLDWTTSILVAAFFATEQVRQDGQNESEEPGGVIWALDPAALNATLPGNPSGSIYGLEMQTRSAEEARNLPEGPDKTVQGLIWAAAGYKTDSDDHVAAVIPTELDTRAMLQQSRFTIHGARSPGWGAAIPVEQQVAGKSRWVLKRYDMAGGASKRNLRRALASLGIRASTLFPDLEHLSVDLQGGPELDMGRVTSHPPGSRGASPC